MNELDANNLDFPSFNPEALKKALDDSKKSSFESEKWRVKVNSKNNKVVFRFAPNPHRLEIPYDVIYYHYNIKKYGLYCLNRNDNSPCPICEQFKILSDDLVKQKEKFKNDNPGVDSKDVQEKFRAQWADLYKIDAQPRFFMSGVLREPGVDKPSISYLEMSSTTKDKICEKLLQHPFLIHPLKGKDWILTFRPKTTKDGKTLGNNRGDIEIDRDEEPSKLLPNGTVEEMKTLINSTPKLKDLIKKPSYAEVQKLFMEGVNEEEESFTEGLTSGNNDASTTKSEEKNSDVNSESIKNELNELFKQE